MLKIGIIGCGGIANGKHMPSLKKLSSRCQMVAFCDLVRERAENAARDFGTPDAKVYEDYKELLKDGSIDIVHVLTPNRAHSYITVDALEAGKNVMCEKPMAINSEEAKKMFDAAKRTGKKLTIGYQNRWGKAAKALKELTEADELGNIYFAKAHAIRRRAVPTWGVFLDEHNQGGGPLIDIGTHALDLTLWLMNNHKPKYVVGTKYRELADNENAANAWGPWDPKEFTVEDSAFGFVVMENGATVFLESSWAINLTDTGEAQTTLVGSKAGATTHKGGLEINGEEKSRLYTKNIDLNVGGVAFYEGAGGDSMEQTEARLWLDAVENNTEVAVKPEEAFVVTQILEGIYESAKTGKPVYFS
jgi:Predicted dehydrogenases and related proteins